MIEPKKLMRSVFLALAVVIAVPVSGAGVPLLGVGAAFAQSQQTLVASVLFEGNRRFSDDQLLTMVDGASRGLYSDAGVQGDAESIRIAYDGAGFRNVSVAPRVEKLDNGRVRITFVINEGERVGIAAINFTGNNSVNAGTLKGVISTKETGILSWLFRDDSYDPQKLGIDKELIRLYYVNHGFPDAEVSAAVTEFDQSRNGYFINFAINEGERYAFSDVSIETSIANLNTDALKGAIRTNKGSRYSLADLQESADEMAIEATDQGFSFADVRPRLDRDEASKTFRVTYLVDEGARVYVERVNITGNDKTRDFVIRRELDFVEGDPFNRAIITRGKAAIEKLGFFSVVDISTAQGSAADKVVININVVEQSTGDYGVTAGYSTQDGILGEVSVTERNFLGRGQYVRAAIGASGSGKTFDFSFTEPRFMGLKISSGFDVYHRINDESDTSYYGTTATGGQVRVGLPITRDLSASLFTGLETKTFSDSDDGGDPLKDSVFVANGDVRNKAWVGYSLTYNGLDDEKKPTYGLYATFSQQYVGWDHNYLKSEVKARYYLPLLEDTGMVASVRGQAGIINDLSGAGVHPTEAFNLGSNLIRGFQGRGYGPRSQLSGEMLGSTAYAGISAEIQFPIPVLPESYGLSGAVWADAAWLDGTGGNLPATAGSTNEPLRTSIGASIIWDSPFGPLRGDFAHVLNKSTDDKTQVFQLTLQSLL